MPARILPMLAVSHGERAIAFYRAAFGAELLWQLGEGADTVAGLAIAGSEFFLACEAPQYGTHAPDRAGFTTVRIELFVDDPFAVQKKAIEAGAREHSPVSEDRFQMMGPHPISRFLQGAVIDPFGHMWLIGKILDEQ